MGCADNRSCRIQFGILAGLLFLFVIIAGGVYRSWVPAGSGVAIAALSIGIARELGSGRPAFWEPMVIWGIGSLLLFASGFIGSFPSFEVWASLCALGSFCVLGAWAIHRVPMPHVPRRTAWSRVKSVLMATLVGVAIAVVLSVLASVLIGVSALGGGGRESAEPLLSFRGWQLLVGAYLVGGVLGGLVVGLLLPLTRWPLGLMVVGIPVAALVYGVVGAAMYLMGDPEGPATIREALGSGLGIGCFAGPMGAIVFRLKWAPLDVAGGTAGAGRPVDVLRSGGAASGSDGA